MTNIQPSLGQIAITISEIDRVLPFYRDILGLSFLFSPAPTIAFLASGDVRIMLTTPQGHGEVGKNSPLYFYVQSLETCFAKMVEMGAQSERAPALVAPMPDHDLWMGFIRDPDGNLIGLMEEKPRDNRI